MSRTDPIRDYLGSPAAVEDVRDLLVRHEARPFPDGSPNHHPATTEHKEWFVGRQGPWRAVWTLRIFYALDGYESSVRVYFRKDEGGRYVVTDMGEGIRAYRLRTGCALDVGVFRDTLPWPDGLDAQIERSNLRASLVNDGMLRAYPKSTEDLPSAICRVLLAAWEVARLGTDSDGKEGA